jgi:hypothetical protein
MHSRPVELSWADCRKPLPETHCHAALACRFACTLMPPAVRVSAADRLCRCPAAAVDRHAVLSQDVDMDDAIERSCRGAA